MRFELSRPIRSNKTGRDDDRLGSSRSTQPPRDEHRILPKFRKPVERPRRDSEPELSEAEAALLKQQFRHPNLRLRAGRDA
jgi:hypothetical protein